MATITREEFEEILHRVVTEPLSATIARLPTRSETPGAQDAPAKRPSDRSLDRSMDNLLTSLGELSSAVSKLGMRMVAPDGRSWTADGRSSWIR